MRFVVETKVALLTAVLVVLLIAAQLPAAEVTVAGRVVAQDTGKPLAGAKVALDPASCGGPGDRREAVTDSDGRFRWAHVLAAQYSISVEAEGYLEKEEGAAVGGANDLDLRLSMVEPPDLCGEIVGPDGQPVARREVLLMTRTREPGTSYWREACRSVTTDDEGWFRLPAWEPGEWKVTALVKGVGYATTALFEVVEGQGPPEFPLELKPAGTLAGRVTVTGTGEPIAGAQVRCGPGKAGAADELVSHTETLADGTFMLTDLTPGDYGVGVRADGYHRERVEVGLEAEEDRRGLVIELVPGGVVRGRVLGPDGQRPLEKAKISWSRSYSTETDAEGRFVLGNLRSGTCNLLVEADGFAPLRHKVEMPETGEPEEQRIVVSLRGGTITGRVIDSETGEPLAGQVVAAVEPVETSSDWGRAEDIAASRLASVEKWELPGGSPFLERTDVEGQYQFSHVPPNTYVVAVARDGGPNPLRYNVEVAEGETTGSIDFQVGRKMTGALAVRVMLPSGEPLADASVETAVDCPNRSGEAQDATSGDGYLYTRLRYPGRYALWVKREGYLPAVVEVEVHDPTAALERTVVLQPIPPGGPPVGSIGGRVFMPDGTTPAKGVFAAPFANSAFFPGADVISSRQGNTHLLNRDLGVETGGDGAFVIEGLPPGRYGVRACLDWTLGKERAPLAPEFDGILSANSELLEVREGEVTSGARIVLGTSGSLRVIVGNAQTNAPVADARVHWRQRGEGERVPFDKRTGSATAGKDGEARVDLLPPGSYSVQVNASGYEAAHEQSVGVEPGKETSIEVRLKPKEG
jgi:5-hydroxyisourate hydrolase-like protein (transthyretin family)